MIEFGIEEKVRKTVIDWVQKVIHSAMKKSKFPDGKAKLGYFEAADGSKENADNVCILVVHYEFRNAKNKDNIRGGDERDVKSLRRSFETNRNCKFIDWSSPKREELLYLLSDQDLLLKLFGAEDSPPSVFFLFILSHGCENGEICTDHAESFDGKVEKFQTFTTTELFAALKKLRKFENCLKFINLAPCRGDTRDLISSIVNQNHQKLSAFDSKSCSVSSFPEMENLVIFYSTVETTAAVRETKNGTWFVQKTCQVLNDLRRTSESLPVVLTRIQNKIQESSHEIMQVSCKDKWIGQTPELKMFPQKRKFVFLPVDSNSKSDGIGKIVIEEPEPLPFWSWPLVGGNQRIKRASVFYTQRTKMVVDFYNALRQNLGFEADDLMENSVGNLSKYFTRINDVAKHTECFLTGVFAKITEKDEEICVRFDDNEVPIGAFIHRFLGPEHENWIGKPKIFIFCEQSPRQSQGDGLKELEIPAATNHSGWLVLVIQDEEKIKTLIEILNSDVLTQNGTSLQEKIYDLLLHQKIGKNNNTLLVSTLQYLLNFPDLPRNFVKPTFSAEVERKTVDYDELLNDWAKGIDRNSFRLLSSPAGSGKTTVMKEIAHGLRKLNKTIVEVNLRDLVYKNFSKWNSETPIAEILAEAMKFPQAHVQALVNKKILILFLDGFDEICPDHGEKMLDLAKRMFDEEIQIFISTRPQEKKAIVDKLGQKNCFAYEILPFNRQQQIELLKLELNECELEMKLKKFEAADISDILANPLHLSLIAQCQDVENLYQIYDEIVRIKIETALKHKKSIVDAKIGEMSQNIIKLMQKLALKYLKLPQEDDQNPRNDIILQRIMSKSRSAIITLNQDVDVLVSDVGVDIDFNLINSTGIVTISGENMKFTHQTFAEFLVAKMFVECDDKNTCSIFCGTNRFWQSRKFVDRFLAQKNHSGENGINIEKTASFFRNEISSESKRADKKNEFLNNIVRDNLVNIFSIVKTVLSLEENDAKLFVPDTLQILGSAFFHGCEDVALELLEMGALKFIQNVSQYLHRWWRLVAANNSLRLFAKLKEKCLELFENSQPVPGMEEIILDAALFGQHQMLQLLLDNGFNVNFQGFGGKNALHVAVEKSYVECVEVLLNYKVLETASSSMVEQTLNLEAKDASGRSALIYAVENDQLILVKMLIEKGADVRVRFEDKHVIHFVKSVAVAKYLLGKDAELVKDLSGRESALHSAVLLGDMELCKLFVSSGVDVNAKDARGDNALFKACDHHAPNTEIIKFLVDSGTDLNHKSSVRGETVLHRAAKFSDSLEVLKLLTENMQEIFTTDDFGNNALMYALDGNREENIEYLLGRNFDLRWSNASGKTALHIAAEKCLLKFLEKLIDLGADVEAKDSDGASVMHWATHNNDVSVAKFLHQNYGGLINQRDNAGALPWHYTAKFSTLDLLSWFADNSEDVKATDNNGQDVLSYLDLREGCDSMDRYLFSISITSIQESQNSTPLACNGCRTETSSQSAPAPSKGPRRQVSRPSATCWPPFLSLFFSFVVFLLFIPLGNSTSDSRQVC